MLEEGRGGEGGVSGEAGGGRRETECFSRGAESEGPCAAAAESTVTVVVCLKCKCEERIYYKTHTQPYNKNTTRVNVFFYARDGKCLKYKETPNCNSPTRQAPRAPRAPHERRCLSEQAHAPRDPRERRP